MPRTRRAVRRDPAARQVTSHRPAPSRAAPARPARRVSGPVGGRAGARVAPQHPSTVGARALAVVRSLPDHSLVDRLVRGRAWIPVLGVLLAGIVASQVEILKLGTSLGRSLDRSAALESQNQTLQAGVASLADAQRIERLATGMGMVSPSPGLLTFVPAGSQNQVGRAIANIHAPDSANFALQLASQATAAQLAAPSTPSASSGTSVGATTGTSSAGVPGQTSSGATGATTTTGQAGTSPSGGGTTAAGSAGGGTVAGSTGTGAGTAAAGPTTVAPSSTGATAGSTTPAGGVTPVGGGGAAGLPATTQPSGGSSGG